MPDRALVTGGAGFIGSHLVRALEGAGWKVRVADDLSRGLRAFLDGTKAEFVKADCTDAGAMADAARGCSLIVHCAADPDVRSGQTAPTRHFEQNVGATANLLEAARKADARTFLFMSTSTVYGDTKVLPTPETLGPLAPISTYGASKLACEALVAGHAATFGFDAINYRFANVLGPRLTHGVVYDFVQKLRRDPKRLEILGDGRQEKSYVHVDDVCSALLLTLASAGRARPLDVFNVGTEQTTPVTRIAELVVEALGLRDVTFSTTGGVEGGRGWKGDVKRMALDVGKLKGLGWKPTHTSDAAVESCAAWMAANA